MSKTERVQIDEKLVKEIASLARLDLTEEETENVRFPVQGHSGIRQHLERSGY